VAHTRQMKKLLQLVGDVQESEEREVPVDQIDRERRSGMSRRQRLAVSRRDFLKAGTGLAMGATMLRRAGADRSSGKAPPSIGIMGAGIAGLVAAYTLQNWGLGSTIYESSDRIGGRMHTLDTSTGYWSDTQYSEWCGELIDKTTHRTMVRLCKTFGLSLRTVAPVTGSQETDYVFTRYYTYAQARSDFAALSATIRSQYKAAGNPTYATSTSEARALDALSVAQWIQCYVPGGLASDFGALLGSVYEAETGRSSSTLSALCVVTVLGGAHPAQETAGFFPWTGTETGTSTIAGGVQQLPVAIRRHITARSPVCSVNTQWAMTAIGVNPNGTITCEFSTPKGLVERTFDEVILTMPFNVLRNLDYAGAGFTLLKERCIAHHAMGTHTKMNLQFDLRYWNMAGPWPGISSGTVNSTLPFQGGWEASLGQPGSSGLEVLFAGGPYGASTTIPQGPYVTVQGSPRARAYVTTYLAQLDQVLPGALAHYNGHATISTPCHDPNLLGSYSTYLVGQFTTQHGYERVRMGNIHFAGEHTSLTFWGFMEGGAASGARAAGEIIRDCRQAGAAV
jgi:monoamine oxidase